MDRTKVIDACVTGDYTTVREAGWLVIYEALKGWWAKSFALSDLAPYVDVLSDESPEEVMATLRELRAEKWRPSPSALYRTLSNSQAEALPKESLKDKYGQRKRKDQSPETLARVRWLLADKGEHVCACMPRPVTVNVDHHHVLRCPKCGGIEQGQVYQAEDEVDF